MVPEYRNITVYEYIYKSPKQNKQARHSIYKLDLRSAIEIIIIIIIITVASSLITSHLENKPNHTFHTRHSLISRFCLDKRNCMSSKEEDKNKQTGTPTQRRTRKEDRDLAKRKAEAKSPDVGKLVPLGRKKSSLALVSPELSYAEMLKGGNTSEPKVTEEGEEEEEEEGEGEEEEENKKPGDEDPKDNNNSSNRPNSNMANALVALAPFDLELTHVLTIVCAFPNNSKPIIAVREFGITDFDDFRSIEYDQKWEYDNSGSQEIVTGNYGMILSTIIAYARDMENQQHADKDTPLNWTHEQFNLWRRTE